MFQYAVARALAYRIGSVVKLDTSAFDGVTGPPFELDRFEIAAERANCREIRRITGLLSTRNGSKARAIRRLCPHLGWIGRCVSGGYIQEKAFDYDPSLVDLPDDVYLSGRWQSEKYFQPVADVIRRDLRLKERHRGAAGALMDHMLNSASVSVHVRRGDYLKQPAGARILEICGLDYYKRATTHVIEKVTEAVFFVFSDDIEFARREIQLPRAVFVDLEGDDKGPRELSLMTMCKHHIIANSTFSWWGAWLSCFQDGVTCAPKTWFTELGLRARRVADLIPETWVQL
jgi:hypothetical protein